jgi:hypothetical protein
MRLRTSSSTKRAAAPLECTHQTIHRRNRPGAGAGNSPGPMDRGCRPPVRFEEISGSEKTWPVDLVLLAMGFAGPEPGTLVAQLNLALDERGNIRTGKRLHDLTHRRLCRRRRPPRPVPDRLGHLRRPRSGPRRGSFSNGPNPSAPEGVLRPSPGLAVRSRKRQAANNIPVPTRTGNAQNPLPTGLVLSSSLTRCHTICPPIYYIYVCIKLNYNIVALVLPPGPDNPLFFF